MSFAPDRPASAPGAAPGTAPAALPASADAPFAPGAGPAESAGARSALPGSPAEGARYRVWQASKFLIVGGLVFFFDAALYNLLVFFSPETGFAAGSHGILFDHPLTAKILTIAVASVLTYLGNRLWTYQERTVERTSRSVAAFIVVNVIASALQLGCLGFSRYVLGLDSVVADNISGTFIGQILSTGFRFVMYGRVVFPRR